MAEELKTMDKNFKQKLLSKELLVGTFVKTPSPMISEVLATTDLDCLCFDAEHSPFARSELDLCLLATKASSMPSIVRVPSYDSQYLQNALDCGSTAVMVPHINTKQKAEYIVQHSFYTKTGRGYAGSTRFAGYGGNTIAQNIDNNSQQNVVIAQIEDLLAIENIEQIAQVAGIDCLFIGVMDITVALNASSADDSKVRECVDRVISVAKKHNKTIGIFVPSSEQANYFKNKGVTLFLLESDHTFLKAGATALKKII